MATVVVVFWFTLEVSSMPMEAAVILASVRSGGHLRQGPDDRGLADPEATGDHDLEGPGRRTG